MHPSKFFLPVLTFVVSHEATNLANAEIRNFVGKIEATDEYVHYSEGFIVAPGYVDVSNLKFTTDTKDGSTGDDFKAKSPNDDGIGDDDGDNNRLLAETSITYKTLQTVDIVLVHEPKNCAKSKAGCDWTELGIGATGDNGDISWCCTDDAIAEGLCDYSEPAYGRMIVNRTLFKGHHRTIRVFDAPNQEKYIKNGMMELKDGMNEDDDASGMYVLIMANCLTTGREVYVEGEYSWKSKHGYLPGDLFDEMYFFAFLVILNSILVVLYGLAMKKYEDAQIPIQKWIFAAMVIGFLETCTKYFNYRIWNSDGKQHWFPLYLGLMVGVSKRAFSRVLVVMVSLGWGVIRDDLGDQMRKIILLGGTYAGFSVARDIVAVVQVIENEKMSVHFEDELFDALTILTFVVAAVDVSFYMWILDSLNSTMQYLESMNQNMKLLRYLRLRLVLLISILFAIAWAVFGIVDNLMEEGMLPLQSAWTLSGVWELNYLFVLISVAVLWRPNESAKNYAYVMELPSLGGDVEFCTNDGLEEDDDELVTSAIDDVETADEKDPPLKVDEGVGA